MSNQHVLCAENEDTSSVDQLAFKFPGIDRIEPRPRSCIFSHFNEGDAVPLAEPGYDLALVYVEEVAARRIVELGTIVDRYPDEGQQIVVCHYGSGRTDP